MATRVCVLTVMVALMASGAIAQPSTGRIDGRVASARGPLANAEIRAKNAATGDVTTVRTSARGEFSVSLPPGIYDVFASPTGYAPLVRRHVSVKAGGTIRVDAVLADNPNAGTPGEIFFL